MSTEELRDELARIGERAPTVDVPDDIFARAGRARRRDRLGVVAAVVVVLLLAGGLAAWLPGRSEPEPADKGVEGVPDVIWAVPSETLEPTADLAVGQAAVALMSDDDLPVVIDAVDGTYAALDLPGFGPVQRAQGTVSLSPDGRHLAWGWSESQPSSGGVVRTGVRILDLVSGEQRSIPSASPIFVYSFTWSPDGRWLVWDGAEGNWGGGGFAAGPETAGRIGPDEDAMTTVPRTSEESTRLTVGNDGAVLIATVKAQTLWDGKVRERSPRNPGSWYPKLLTPQEGVLLESIVRSDDPTTFRVAYRKPASPQPVPAPALSAVQLVPLGWIGRSSVAITQTYGEESADLSVIDLEGEVGLRKVGELRGASPRSVAVDLMTTERPTVDRPEPEWLDQDEGWSDARLWITIGLSVALLSALMVGAGWLWRRRRVER